MFTIVAAADLLRGIGKEGKLPWPPLRNKERSDLKEFREVTLGGIAIMGHATYLSLGEQPLPDRINIVISREPSSLKGSDIVRVSSLDEALLCSSRWGKPTFVIGGAKIYEESISHPRCQGIRLTRVHHIYDCDRFFPKIPEGHYQRIASPEGIPYLTDCGVCVSVELWERRAPPPRSVNNPVYHNEEGYLRLLKRILNDKDLPLRADRTRVGTYSIFGPQLTFDLQRFPLLTTKKMSLRLIAEELFWFLRGSTRESDLSAKGVNIWAGNARAWGRDDLGPIYGWQWRNFGAKHPPPSPAKRGEEEPPFPSPDGEGEKHRGVDQVTYLLKQLREDPTSRRHILTAWNPVDLPKMALPPCHLLSQYYVEPPEGKESRGRISCHLYQRSADLGLGLPFNISSYALLTYLLGHFSGLTPHRLIISIGDAHIYSNHVGSLREQIERQPYRFPTLSITGSPKDIFSVEFRHLRLEDYRSWDTVKMSMAV